MNSIMFSVKVDRREPTELHVQVAAEIRRAIADGEARPGERLPPARDLAAVLGVNANTVLRALRVLRDEGLLEFRRGRGVTVAGTPQRGEVVARAREFVRFAREQGYRADELVRMDRGPLLRSGERFRLSQHATYAVTRMSTKSPQFPRHAERSSAVLVRVLGTR
jgi:GntR family transcriptional regulator